MSTNDLSRMLLLTGAEAAAHAMRQINPDVVPIYPITPQTPIVQTFSKFVADGKAHSEVINVESEHSAMSVAIGAAASGARTMTATASQGLALMIENVYIAASMRLPIVMAVGNRALSGPLNIHCDHSDGMLARDSGAVQVYVENAQEAYDFMILASKFAVDSRVLLPVMVCQDGFTLTHTAEPVELLEEDEVQPFIGEYKIPYPLLDQSRVTTQGPFDMPDYYFEHKRQQADAMSEVPTVLLETARRFGELCGRRYDIIESYKLEDAERVIVVLGSTAGTVKDEVDELRAAGERVGLLRILLFRPFPDKEVRQALRGALRVAVLDRAMSFGSFGPLFTEICRALYGRSTAVQNYTFGLGGRDLYPEQVRKVFDDLKSIPGVYTAGHEMFYIGVRE
ncbi:MAG TPA: pyruvate ferredoxin oxidoreductase [Spirochaetia bacterium]|nr:pyruvate ferredoxin oxidoreductase [Spirochaetia bacterium]